MPFFDPALILDGIQQGTLKTLDLSAISKRSVKKLTTLHNIQHLAVLPTGVVISWINDDNNPKVWNPLTGECLQTLRGKVSWGYDNRDAILAILPTGEVVMKSVENSSTLKVWNPLTGQCIQTLAGHTKQVTFLTVLPTGEVVSGSEDSSLKVWNVQTGKCLQTLTEVTKQVGDFWVLPTGELVTTTSSYRSLKVWNLKTGQCVQTLTNFDYYKTSGVVLLPTGELVCESDTLKVWNLKTRRVRTLKGHTKQVCAILVLPTGQLVTGSDDLTLKVWNTRTGQCVHTLTGHTKQVTSLTVLPTGEVVSYDSYILKVWNPQTGRCLRTLERSNHGFVVLPTGEVVCNDILKDWNPLKGQCVLLHDKDEYVRALALLPTGEVVSGSCKNDETAKVWKLIEVPLSYYDVAILFEALIKHPGTLEHLNLTGVDLTHPKAYAHLVAVLKAHPQLQTLILDKTGAISVEDFLQRDPCTHQEKLHFLKHTIPFFEPAPLLDSIQQGTLNTLDLSAILNTSVKNCATLNGDVRGDAVLPTGEVVSRNHELWNPHTGKCLKTWRKDHAYALVVLPNGEVVFGCADNTLKVYNPYTGECLQTLTGHTGAVSTLALLPTGEVVSGSHDHTLKVWNLNTGQCVQTLTGHGAIYALALLPSGEVVSGSSDQTLKVWNPLTGQCLQTLGLSTWWHKQLAVLPSGEVVSLGDDNTLKVWNPLTGECVQNLGRFKSSVDALVVLPTGEVVVSGGGVNESENKDYYNNLKVWNPSTGECVQTLVEDESYIRVLTVLPSGELVSGSSDRTLKVWNPLTGQCLHTLMIHDSIQALTVLPTGEVMTYIGVTQVWRLIEVPLSFYDVAVLFEALIQYPGTLEHLNLTGVDLTHPKAYARLIAVLKAHPQLQTLILDKTGLPAVEDIMQDASRAQDSPPFFNEGQIIPFFYPKKLLKDIQQGTLKSLDLSTVSKYSKARGYYNNLSGISFAVLPTGELVTGGSQYDHTLKVWNPQTWECIQTLKGHTSAVYALAVLPTGEVVSGSDDNILKVWNLQTGQCVQTLIGHTSAICQLAVLPTGEVVSGGNRAYSDKRRGEILASIYQGDGCTLKVWNLQTGKCIQTLMGHTSAIFALAILPTGEVVTGSKDRTLKVWNPLTGQCIQTLRGHTSAICAVAVLPTGELVSGSATTRDGDLKVWNPYTGQCLQTLKSGPVLKLLVLPSGELMVGGNTLRVWNLQTGRCVQTLETFNTLKTLEYSKYSEDRENRDFVSALALLPTGEVLSLVQEQCTIKIFSRSPLSYADDKIDALFWAFIKYPGTLEHLNLTGVDLTSPNAYLHLMSVVRVQPQLQTLILENTGLTPAEQENLQNLLLLQVKNVPKVEEKRVVSRVAPVITLPLPSIKTLDVEVPNNYKCPITHEIMRNPVITVDGYTFEEEAILLHFETSSNSPVTSATLPLKQVFPNHVLRSIIQEFLDKYPEFLEEGQTDTVYYSLRLQKKALQAIQAADVGTLLDCIAEDKRVLTRPFEGDFLLSHVLEQQKPDLLQDVLNIFTLVDFSRLFAQRPLEDWLENLAKLRITRPATNTALLTCFLDVIEKITGGVYSAIALVDLGLEYSSRAFLEVGLMRLGSVNMPLDEEGNTALHQAARKGDITAVRLLLELDADPGIKNKAGQKPRDIARAEGHKDVVNKFTDAKILPTLQRLGFFEQFPQFREFLQNN